MKSINGTKDGVFVYKYLNITEYLLTLYILYYNVSTKFKIVGPLPIVQLATEDKKQYCGCNSMISLNSSFDIEKVVVCEQNINARRRIENTAICKMERD